VKKINSHVKKESYLKNLARQLLKEDESITSEKGVDSLDEQIDRYFSEYESSAKVTTEGYNFQKSLRQLLSEAEKEEKSDEPIKKLGADSINVEDFANNVARLIENYDSLLEVRSTILRRAINFLSKSYDLDVADSLRDVLKSQHSMVDGKTKREVEEEEFVAPAADRAGPSGAG
jgi:hypothetical protein